jgi:hypothetical protein
MSRTLDTGTTEARAVMKLLKIAWGGATRATEIAGTVVILAFAHVGSLTEALIPMETRRDALLSR